MISRYYLTLGLVELTFQHGAEAREGDAAVLVGSAQDLEEGC